MVTGTDIFIIIDPLIRAHCLQDNKDLGKAECGELNKLPIFTLLVSSRVEIQSRLFVLVLDFFNIPFCPSHENSKNPVPVDIWSSKCQSFRSKGPQKLWARGISWWWSLHRGAMRALGLCRIEHLGRKTISWLGQKCRDGRNDGKGGGIPSLFRWES